jgi:hypothetical protein
MEFKHGNDQRHADGIGGVYVHGNDDGRLYGRYEYDNGNNHGDSGYGCWIGLIITNPLYQYAINLHYAYHNQGYGHRYSDGIASWGYGVMGFEYDYNQRHTDGFRDL